MLLRKSLYQFKKKQVINLNAMLIKTYSMHMNILLRLKTISMKIMPETTIIFQTNPKESMWKVQSRVNEIVNSVNTFPRKKNMHALVLGNSVRSLTE